MTARFFLGAICILFGGLWGLAIHTGGRSPSTGDLLFVGMFLVFGGLLIDWNALKELGSMILPFIRKKGNGE